MIDNFILCYFLIYNLIILFFFYLIVSTYEFKFKYFSSSVWNLLILVVIIFFSHFELILLIFFRDIYHIINFFNIIFILNFLYIINYFQQLSFYNLLFLCFFSFLIFILTVLVRIVTPRYKFESLSKLGWTYGLIIIIFAFLLFFLGFLLS